MTQAFNLSQLANNLNSSGQLDATDGLTGAVPVANGGTGQTTYSNGQLLIGNGTGLTKATITAGSGISVTNGSGSITIASSGGGVTSLNGQTGAITNTDFGAIGSYVIAGEDNFTGGLERSTNSTVAGSSLIRSTTVTLTSGISSAQFAGSYIQNTLYTSLGLSGTWRRMTRSYQNGGANSSANLYVRIS